MARAALSNRKIPLGMPIEQDAILVLRHEFYHWWLLAMPLKRKDRPESWSSNASSPEEKKAREKNHSALESGSEDDVLKALNMADNLGS